MNGALWSLGYVLVGLIILAVGHAFATCRAWTKYPHDDYRESLRATVVFEWMFLIVPSALFWPAAILLVPVILVVLWLFKISASAGKSCAMRKRGNQSCPLS